jgi:hypothetical protein
MDKKGCRKFVLHHIIDCEKILSRLEEVHLTLSESKSIFRIRKLVIVEHMCESYGQKPSLDKINAINKIEHCKKITEVQRFLSACIFYLI